jgi:hypothetical protein
MKWWKSLGPEGQRAYLKEHPNSIYKGKEDPLGGDDTTVPEAEPKTKPKAKGKTYKVGKKAQPAVEQPKKPQPIDLDRVETDPELRKNFVLDLDEVATVPRDAPVSEISQKIDTDSLNEEADTSYRGATSDIDEIVEKQQQSPKISRTGRQLLVDFFSGDLKKQAADNIQKRATSIRDALVTKYVDKPGTLKSALELYREIKQARKRRRAEDLGLDSNTDLDTLDQETEEERNQRLADRAKLKQSFKNLGVGLAMIGAAVVFAPGLAFFASTLTDVWLSNVDDEYERKLEKARRERERQQDRLQRDMDRRNRTNDDDDDDSGSRRSRSESSSFDFDVLEAVLAASYSDQRITEKDKKDTLNMITDFANWVKSADPRYVKFRTIYPDAPYSDYLEYLEDIEGNDNLEESDDSESFDDDEDSE